MSEWMERWGERKLISPQLVSSSYGFTREQSDTWEAQILVFGEHTHRKQIGLAEVVHEPTDVAVEPGIDAVDLANLDRQIKSILFLPSRNKGDYLYSWETTAQPAGQMKLKAPVSAHDTV